MLEVLDENFRPISDVQPSKQASDLDLDLQDSFPSEGKQVSNYEIINLMIDMEATDQKFANSIYRSEKLPGETSGPMSYLFLHFFRENG